MPAWTRKLSLFALLAFSLFLLSTAGYAQTDIVLDDGNAGGPVLTVDRSDCSSVELSLFVNTLTATPLETKGGAFCLLSLEDYGFTGEIGRPSLPVMREFIEAPHGAGCKLVLSDAVWAEYALDDLGIDTGIVPAQAPVAKIEGAQEAAPFVIDQAAYGTDAYVLSETARISEEVVLRGRRLLVLEVFPVDYNPAAGTVRILTSATIGLEFSGADVQATSEKLARYSTPTFDRLIHSVVLNGAAFAASVLGAGSKPNRAIGYLMIAAPAYVGNSRLQDLVNLRTSQGYSVTLVDTNTTGTSASAIKSYIQDAYNTWAPECVLLIGDTNTIPYWTGLGSYSPATDLTYFLLDGGDYVPDVLRGRLPVRSDTQLTNLCDKIIAMNGNTLKKAVFMASEDNYRISEGTHNYVISNYLEPDGWTSDKLYCHTYNATTSQVSTSFNDGRSVGCFSGHGSSTSWADGPYFSQSNVRALINDTYPFVLSFACLTGKYENTECFAETWVVDDHGSASFYGASESSYWTEDDIFEKRIFKGWYDLDLDTIGGMLDYGQYELYLWMSSSTSFKRMYYEMYNLMGEPSQRVIDGGGGGVDPAPDIKVNGQDGTVNVNQGTPVSVTISLDPGDFAGVAHDWWVWCGLSSNQAWWVPGQGWIKSWNPIRAYDGGLFSVSNYPVGGGSNLPAGTYDLNFAVDVLNNIYEGTYSDSVLLIVN
jgi:hypothetical protein